MQFLTKNRQNPCHALKVYDHALKIHDHVLQISSHVLKILHVNISWLCQLLKKSAKFSTCLNHAFHVLYLSVICPYHALAFSDLISTIPDLTLMEHRLKFEIHDHDF